MSLSTHVLNTTTGLPAAADYFDGAATLYPYVDITFTISDERGGAHGHLHIPLLLSPYGYSTYLGS